MLTFLAANCWYISGIKFSGIFYCSFFLEYFPYDCQSDPTFLRRRVMIAQSLFSSRVRLKFEMDVTVFHKVF